MDYPSKIFMGLVFASWLVRYFSNDDVKKKIDVFYYSGIGPFLVGIAIVLITR